MAVVGMICRDRVVSDELRCRTTSDPFGVPGFIVYDLEESTLVDDHFELNDRIAGYSSAGLVAVAEPANREFLYYPLIPAEHIRSLLDWFNLAWNKAVDV